MMPTHRRSVRPADRDADPAEAHHEHGRAFDDLRGVDDRPTPVCSAQPTTAARSSGMSSSMRTTPLSVVTGTREATDTEPFGTRAPLRDSADVPSGSSPVMNVRARTDRVLSPHAPAAPTTRCQGDEHHVIAGLTDCARTGRLDDPHRLRGRARPAGARAVDSIIVRSE